MVVAAPGLLVLLHHKSQLQATPCHDHRLALLEPSSRGARPPRLAMADTLLMAGGRAGMAGMPLMSTSTGIRYVWPREWLRLRAAVHVSGADARKRKGWKAEEEEKSGGAEEGGTSH